MYFDKRRPNRDPNKLCDNDVVTMTSICSYRYVRIQSINLIQ